MPQELSALCRATMSISSSVSSSLSSLIRVAWSEHMGVQTAEGVTKLTEDGSGLNLPNREPSTSGAKFESRSRSSHVVSPSPVYNQVGRARF
jgi:hypothetical protein